MQGIRVLVDCASESDVDVDGYLNISDLQGLGHTFMQDNHDRIT
jgi:hypothetical protein